MSARHWWIGGESATTARMSNPEIDHRLPGNPAVDRMWLVRAMVWIASRRFALVLVLIGVLTLLAAIRQTVTLFSLTPRLMSSSTMEAIFSPSGNSSSSMSSENGTIFSPRAASVAMILGSALTALGALWLARRFSLRWLLGAVLLTGVLGAIPLQATPPPGGAATFTVIFTQPFSTAQIAAVREQLAPERTVATLPPAFRALLNSDPRAGIVGMDVTAWDGKTDMKTTPSPQGGVRCAITLCGDLSFSERRELIQFFDYYVKYLALVSDEAQGHSNNQKSDLLTASGSFEPYRKAWLQRAEKP